MQEIKVNKLLSKEELEKKRRFAELKKVEGCKLRKK